ncbi:hypothetical protein GMORB2_1455 [Geosmithia morbida]|uniref:Geranylgeranyl pyrophosphate synthetase n=1 Tax=Geosmithia morbida TaxID=1094350 RepID=A0A9P4Z3Z9_9HYPO|nr:uncharacterized protein GMORB2_1455 [Geosmithia morbida]KAF4126209.1 hypothetical protein GMORB2_1455 [Geosmithia morbida]
MLHKRGHVQSFRGARRGTWGSGSPRGGRGACQQPKLVEETPPPPCGPLLEEISLEDILDRSRGELERHGITDCELVASYNWLDKPGRSMIIPGMPPRWTPPPFPSTLKKDSGTYYRDQNACWYPAHPTEPGAEAIMRLKADQQDTRDSFDVDIFACGSTLGNLLRFVNGGDMKFRMLVEVVGKTVHLIRRENSPYDTIPGVYGYGHTFPEAYTTWDSPVRGSDSHQRIVRYRLGGMHFLVRSKGDGYLPDKVPENLRNVSSDTGESHRASSIDSLASALAGNSVSRRAQSSEGQPSLQISVAGQLIPQEAVFNLKTRSAMKKLDGSTAVEVLEVEVPRLWVSQIPNLVLAYHKRGLFDDIEIQDARPAIAKWESDKEPEVKRFVVLLRKIVEIARSKDDGKFEIVRNDGENVIRIMQQMPDVAPAFSPETAERWERWLDAGGNKSDSHSDQRSYEEESSRFDQGSDLNDTLNHGWSDDSGSEKDLTACDEECGYCGRCVY